MSMSTYILGIMKPDEDYNKAYRAWEACREAGVEPPMGLCERLGIEDYDRPNPTGATVELKPRREEPPTDTCEEWLEIDLDTLPKGVSVIRVVHSW